jgi:hypothetical protein
VFLEDNNFDLPIEDNGERHFYLKSSDTLLVRKIFVESFNFEIDKIKQTEYKVLFDENSNQY